MPEELQVCEMAGRRRLALFVGGLVASIVPAIAQGADSTSETWPELQVFVRLNDSTRLLLNPAPTRSRETDDRTGVDYGVYVDYREPKAAASYRVGYVQSNTNPAGPEESKRSEQRIVLDYNYRWKLGAAGQLTDRTRLDLRDKEGTSSQRLRNRVQYDYETQLGELPFVPYANLELYYDTRYDAISRYKTELGATFVFSPQADVGLYFGRQTDTKPARTNINALGLVLALHF